MRVGVLFNNSQVNEKLRVSALAQKSVRTIEIVVIGMIMLTLINLTPLSMMTCVGGNHK